MMNLTGGALGQLGWSGWAGLVVETGWVATRSHGFPGPKVWKDESFGVGVAGIHGVERERERHSNKQNEGCVLALFHQ